MRGFPHFPHSARKGWGTRPAASAGMSDCVRKKIRHALWAWRMELKQLVG